MPPFSFRRWIQKVFAPVAGRRRDVRRRSVGPRRLSAERLEHRQLLTTYTVTNTDDDGAGSLRDAVDKANADRGEDTIVFDAKLANKTIALTSGTSENGETALTIRDRLTIDATAAPGLRLSGNGERRILTVRKFSCTLIGLTLENGVSRGGDGGAGYDDGGRVVAGGGGGAGMGGAVFVYPNAVFKATDTIFANNKAIGGNGGDYVKGSSRTTYGSYGGALGASTGAVSGKVGSFGLGGRGGDAAYQYTEPKGGPTRAFGGGFGAGGGGGLDQVAFGGIGGFGGGGGGGSGFFDAYKRVSNRGYGGGTGGLYNGGGGAGMGGAIFGFQTLMFLTNCTFKNNKAVGGSGYESGEGIGGAFFNSGNDNSGVFTTDLRGCTFTGNSADKGGAICIGETVPFYFDFSPPGKPGPGYAAKMNIKNCEFNGNTSSFGAAVYNAGLLNSPDSMLENNRASVQGGAYYNAIGGVLTIARDKMIGNAALRDGGGIANFGTLTLVQATFDGNEATRRNGGGLANFGTADVEGGTFRRNDAGLDGGGVSNARGAALDLTGVSLIQNDAGHDGGAIFDRGIEAITECELIGNTADEAGAGFYELGGIGETFENSLFEDGNEVTNDPDTVLGSAAGVVGTVQFRDDETNQTTLNFQPYGAAFKGGVRVATGYLADKDGVPTQVIVTAPASGMAPLIKVFDAFSGNLIRTITGAATLGSKGVSLAVGDVTGDGLDDVVVGSGPGVKSLVVVYDGATGKAVKSITPFAATFPGGINVAVGDTTGDGTAEIVVGAGRGAAVPGVAVLSFATGKQLTGWGLDATKFAGGVNVAVVDRNGDGYGDVVAAQAAGSAVTLYRDEQRTRTVEVVINGVSETREETYTVQVPYTIFIGSTIIVFDGRGMRKPLASFEVYRNSSVDGINIASDDVDGDGLPDLVVSPARGNTVKVVAFNPRTFKPIEAFTADKNFTKGIYLG
jgi:hypothetical protein